MADFRFFAGPERRNCPNPKIFTLYNPLNILIDILELHPSTFKSVRVIGVSTRSAKNSGRVAVFFARRTIFLSLTGVFKSRLEIF